MGSHLPLALQRLRLNKTVPAKLKKKKKKGGYIGLEMFEITMDMVAVHIYGDIWTCLE